MKQKLFYIKLVHTLIWVFYNVVLFYLFYAVVANKIDRWVWICIALVLAEAAVLLLFKTVCPITLIARRYSNSQRDNFDIFLPNWLARHNKTIYGGFFLLSLVILAYRLIAS